MSVLTEKRLAKLRYLTSPALQSQVGALYVGIFFCSVICSVQQNGNSSCVTRFVGYQVLWKDAVEVLSILLCTRCAAVFMMVLIKGVELEEDGRQMKE